MNAIAPQWNTTEDPQKGGYTVSVYDGSDLIPSWR